MKMRTSHKMYLTLILSTACIFLYQYQLSKARLLSSSSQQSIVLNEVLQLHQSQLLATKFHRKSQAHSGSGSADTTTTRTTTTTISSTAVDTTKNTRTTTRLAKKPISDNSIDISTSNSDSLSTPQSPKNYNNIQSSLFYVQTNNTQNTQYSINTTSGHVIIYVKKYVLYFFVLYLAVSSSCFSLFLHSSGISNRFSELMFSSWMPKEIAEL